MVPSSAACGREDLVVEDGFVDRDGDVLLGLELDSRPQLLLVDLRKLHRTYDDLLVRHAQLDAFACETALFPEDFEFVCEAVCVDDFALEHESLGKSADRSMRQHVVLLSRLDLDGSYGGLLQIETHTHSVLRHDLPRSPLFSRQFVGTFRTTL